MKNYHTATQEDYNALMIELENKGCMWYEEKPTAKNYWPKNEEKTYVMEENGYLTYGRMEPSYRELYPFIEYKAKGENMTVYHVETQENYDALMIELEEKGCKWRGGEKLTDSDKFSTHGKDTYVYEECCEIYISSRYYFKKQHIDVPVIEYKAKRENMTQEEKKHNLQKIAFDISVAISTFARGTLTVEADLQEAKSSAKKLIEKIDEYLETLKPKFKVRDYVTYEGVNENKIAKIDSINEDELHGLWYGKEKEGIRQDWWFKGGDTVRHATTEEIKEYESALNFHKHGRKPFELKRGDVVYLKGYDKNIFLDSGNIYKKHNFVNGDVILVKTVEEVNEWL